MQNMDTLVFKVVGNVLSQEVLSVASLVSHTQGEKITYLPRNKCLNHGYISGQSRGKCFNSTGEGNSLLTQ